MDLLFRNIFMRIQIIFLAYRVILEIFRSMSNIQTVLLIPIFLKKVVDFNYTDSTISIQIDQLQMIDDLVQRTFLKQYFLQILAKYIDLYSFAGLIDVPYQLLYHFLTNQYILVKIVPMQIVHHLRLFFLFPESIPNIFFQL